VSRISHQSRDITLAGEPSGAVVVARLPMAGNRLIKEHRHPWHQIAWAGEGVISVDTPGATYVLSTAQALWIPAGVPHAVTAHGRTTLVSPYLQPGDGHTGWPEPTVLAVRPLLAALINHLADPGLRAEPRSRAEAVVADLLEPVAAPVLHLPWPRDPRATHVADALRADPADQRSLQAWGRAAGASGRTLARLFTAETGMSFAQWRTQARLRAALALLAAGEPVSRVAHRVGYSAPSAFIAAFRRVFGVAPGGYRAI
jgi:AraC-like DNA-binding protein/quercetin dioxygenase-like cupin family protein